MYSVYYHVKCLSYLLLEKFLIVLFLLNDYSVHL